MVDYAALLYNPVYSALGVDATLTLIATGRQVALTVLDKTEGVQVSLGGDIDAQIIKPCCKVRVPELTSNDIDLADLKGSRIAFNGNTWRIENKRAIPSRNGEAQGQMLLILIEDTDA